MTDERRPTKLISAEGHRKKSSGLSSKAQNTKLAAVLVGFQKKEQYYGCSPRVFPALLLATSKCVRQFSVHEVVAKQSLVRGRGLAARAANIPRRWLVVKGACQFLALKLKWL